MATQENESLQPFPILSRMHEATLRKHLEVALKGICLSQENDHKRPRTLAMMEVNGELIAVVRIPLRPAASLSPRQRQISLLVAQGLTNKEIAVKLCLRKPTIAAQLQRIFRKLDITTRAALAGMSPLFS